MGIKIIPRLDVYRHAINSAARDYCQQQRSEIDELAKKSHPSVGRCREAFLDMLCRKSGKRVRGILVMAGYEMFGGNDLNMAARAALAIEMIQTGALVLDDIQDKSAERRGGPSLHAMLTADSAKYGWTDDPTHNGVSLAINAGTQGLHQARTIIEELEGSSEGTRLTASILAGKTIARTCDGQNADSSMRATDLPGLENIYEVIEAKTAHYSILNPLQVGMVLAGASLEEAAALEQFALSIGIVYQITNDLKVVGGEGADDITGNKPTIVICYALKRTGPADKEFLYSMLGNKNMNSSQFAQCQQILIRSEAVIYAKQEIERHKKSAEASFPKSWPPERIEFLEQVAGYIVNAQN